MLLRWVIETILKEKREKKVQNSDQWFFLQTGMNFANNGKHIYIREQIIANIIFI